MRIVEGADAQQMVDLIDTLRHVSRAAGFSEILIPSVWEQQTFVDKAGSGVLNQMYVFKDRGDRDLCLLPEVTAVIQEKWKAEWSKRKQPMKVFYVNRCYRYERPQAGRYREFTQFGVEFLGGSDPVDRIAVETLAYSLMKESGISFEWDGAAKRGLDYYVEDGFEARVASLGAQKQVLGGGRYESGIGFAIGVDRLALAMANDPT